MEGIKEGTEANLAGMQLKVTRKVASLWPVTAFQVSLSEASSICHL